MPMCLNCAALLTTQISQLWDNKVYFDFDFDFEWGGAVQMHDGLETHGIDKTTEKQAHWERKIKRKINGGHGPGQKQPVNRPDAGVALTRKKTCMRTITTTYTEMNQEEL